MVPSNKFTKTDGQTGVVSSGGLGTLLIIAVASQGATLLPGAYQNPSDMNSTFGDGPLVQIGAYDVSTSSNPVVLLRPVPSIAAVYGGFTTVGGGTSAASAGATAPTDDYDVEILFVAAGNVTVNGITYQVSLDGGNSFGPTLALGTSNNIVIPNTGITVALSNGTILAGETVSFSVKAARINNTDLAAALEAARTYGAEWEGMLISGLDADSNTVGLLDAWFAARESEGKFRFFSCNARRRNPGESEAAYLTALTAVAANMSSIRGVVGADGCDVVSVGGSKPVRGIASFRDTATVTAIRAASIDISEDPAFIGRGPLVAANVNTVQNTPKYHDEQAFPGLDDVRFTTLRNVTGESGAFVDNAKVISPAGSDYVFLQHVRVMNRACAVAWQRLNKLLSKGIKKDPKTGFILESEARSIEDNVNTVLRREMKNRVSGVNFKLNRDDDLSSNEGATIRAELELDALAYIKGFVTNAHFVRTLSVAA